MNPSRQLIYALGALFSLGLLLGLAAALGYALPDMFNTAWWGLLLCLGGVTIIDAWQLHRLPSPSVRRMLPGSLAQGGWQDVHLDIHHALEKPTRVEIFDHAPDGLQFEQLPQTLTLAPGQDRHLSYRLQPMRRGHFYFAHCELRVYSPFGLWRDRRVLPVESQTRVYPDFTRLNGAPLMAVDRWLSRLGVRQQPRRGLGHDFHQLREYREGDTLRQIDWKATARKRAPIVREYQDERDQQVLLMLDCGRRMRSQDGTLSHFDHALNASLLLSYVALRQGDALGLYTFATEQRRFFPPAKGQRQLNALLNGVYDLINTQQPADFSLAASDILGLQKRRALVIIISNLRDEDDENLLDAVQRLSRRHRVLVVSLREAELDKLRQQPVISFQDALDYYGAFDYLAARQSLHERLLAHGVPVLDARPGELGPALISRYLSWKKEGVL
jgi:uncharacterized protein (DUF58 family)